MKKININDKKNDINNKLYFFLKKITQSKVSESRRNEIIKACEDYEDNYKKFLNALKIIIKNIKNKESACDLKLIHDDINQKEDVYILEVSLRLLKIKTILIKETSIIIEDKEEKLTQKYHPLSLSYDNITSRQSYESRVGATLYTKKFFEMMEKNIFDFFDEEINEYIKKTENKIKKLKKQGVEAYSVFMIILLESLQQRNKSTAGGDYEKRTYNVLLKTIKEESITKHKHDPKKKHIEYDYIIKIKNKIIGIGAKRTSRERYKQFLNTKDHIEADVMIHITLGIDMTENKLNTIASSGAYVFVSDEIYEGKPYLQESKHAYKCSSLDKKTLQKIAEQNSI